MPPLKYKLHLSVSSSPVSLSPQAPLLHNVFCGDGKSEFIALHWEWSLWALLGSSEAEAAPELAVDVPSATCAKHWGGMGTVCGDRHTT